MNKFMGCSHADNIANNDYQSKSSYNPNSQVLSTTSPLSSIETMNPRLFNTV